MHQKCFSDFTVLRGISCPGSCSSGWSWLSWNVKYSFICTNNMKYIYPRVKMRISAKISLRIIQINKKLGSKRTCYQGCKRDGILLDASRDGRDRDSQIIFFCGTVLGFSGQQDRQNTGQKRGKTGSRDFFLLLKITIKLLVSTNTFFEFLVFSRIF